MGVRSAQKGHILVSDSKNKPCKPNATDQQAEDHVESSRVFLLNAFQAWCSINSHHDGGGDGRGLWEVIRVR